MKGQYDGCIIRYLGEKGRTNLGDRAALSVGGWSEEEYLALDTNHLVEFSAGYVEVLPIPGFAHQRLVFFLHRLLWAFVTERGLGEILSAPLPVQLWAKKHCEPDLIFIRTEKLPSPA